MALHPQERGALRLSGSWIDHDALGSMGERADAVAQHRHANGAPARMRQPVRFQQDPPALRGSNKAHRQVERRICPVLKGQVGRDAAREIRRCNRPGDGVRRLLIDQRAFHAKPNLGWAQMTKASEARHDAELIGEPAGHGAKLAIRRRLHTGFARASRISRLANKQGGRPNKSLIIRDQFKHHGPRLPSGANGPCTHLQSNVDRRRAQEVDGEARHGHRAVRHFRLGDVRQQGGRRAAMAMAWAPGPARGWRGDEPVGLVTSNKDRAAHAHRVSGQSEKSHPEGPRRVAASGGLDT